MTIKYFCGMVMGNGTSGFSGATRCLAQKKTIITILHIIQAAHKSKLTEKKMFYGINVVILKDVSYNFREPGISLQDLWSTMRVYTEYIYWI